MKSRPYKGTRNTDVNRVSAGRTDVPVNGRDCFWPEPGIRTQHLSGRARGRSRVEKAFKARGTSLELSGGSRPDPDCWQLGSAPPGSRGDSRRGGAL